MDEFEIPWEDQIAVGVLEGAEAAIVGLDTTGAGRRDGDYRYLGSTGLREYWIGDDRLVLSRMGDGPLASEPRIRALYCAANCGEVARIRHLDLHEIVTSVEADETFCEDHTPEEPEPEEEESEMGKKKPTPTPEPETVEEPAAPIDEIEEAAEPEVEPEPTPLPAPPPAPRASKKGVREPSVGKDGLLTRTADWPYRVYTDPSGQANSYLVVEADTGQKIKRITGRGWAQAHAKKLSALKLGVPVFEGLAPKASGPPRERGQAGGPHYHVAAVYPGGGSDDLGRVGRRQTAEGTVKQALKQRLMQVHKQVIAALERGETDVDAGEFGRALLPTYRIEECVEDHADTAALAAD